MKQLDTKAVWLFFLSSIVSWLVLLMMLSFLGGSFLKEFGVAYADGIFFSDLLYWLLVLTPVALIICFIWSKLTYYFYRYELMDAGFRKELGVIYKKYVTIPYDRIQNVDISRGILDRILGLSSLNIQTAGSSDMTGAEGRLPGLSREVAEQLRDELIQRARQSTNHGL